MNKKTFLQTLKKELKGLPEEEIDEILDDYEEHFAIGKKKRRKEETIAKELGNPKTLAKQYKTTYHIKQAEKKQSAQNILRAVLASLGMTFFNLIFVLGPFLGLVGILIGLYAASIGIAAAGIATMLGSIATPLLQQYITINTGGGIGLFFLGTGTAALGALMLIGTIYVTKGFAKASIMYLKFNISIITGKKGEDQ